MANYYTDPEASTCDWLVKNISALFYIQLALKPFEMHYVISVYFFHLQLP